MNYPTYRQQVITVNGENGARAFQMMPSSSVLLLDQSAPIVWLKQTDGAGYPTITPYEIKPYVPPAPIDVRALEQRLLELERRLGNESNTEADE